MFGSGNFQFLQFLVGHTPRRRRAPVLAGAVTLAIYNTFAGTDVKLGPRCRRLLATPLAVGACRVMLN